MDTDFVTRFENLVDASAQRSADRIKKAIKEKYTRQPFSQKVPKEQMDLEYDLMKDNPSVMAQFLKDQHGSLESAVHYFETMERRRASG